MYLNILYMKMLLLPLKPNLKKKKTFSRPHSVNAVRITFIYAYVKVNIKWSLDWCLVVTGDETKALQPFHFNITKVILFFCLFIWYGHSLTCITCIVSFSFSSPKLAYLFFYYIKQFIHVLLCFFYARIKRWR